MGYIVKDERGRERGRGTTGPRAWYDARNNVARKTRVGVVPQLRAWFRRKKRDGWRCEKVTA